MKKTIWLPAVLLILLFSTQAAFCQETFTVQKPEGVADFSYQAIAPGKLLITASDSAGNPVRGLTAKDFVLLRKGKKARILDVKTLETSQDVGLNLVLVVDNSASMKHRKAIEPILAAMENIYQIVRPIDNITVIVFNDDKVQPFGDRKLHVTVKRSNRPDELRAFVKKSFNKGLTDKTVLYEGMLAGLSLIRQMPVESNKFMLVFTDGEDINSAYPETAVRQAAEGLSQFELYAIDYMPGEQIDPFLESLSRENGGRTWKATTAEELGSIFEAVSSKLIYRYVVEYKFLFPPTGSIAMGVDNIRIEEVTTIESAPLLNYVYFDEGQSGLDARYARFQSPEETQLFEEEALRGTLGKYANLLNVIGLRLRNHPDASVRLVGCNANVGDEKGSKELSRARAESVKAYLQYIWGIDPARMMVEARNLPEVPSSGKTPEGQAENRRVEILSEDAAILDVVKSAYVETRGSEKALTVKPRIDSEHGIENWTLTLLGDGNPILSSSGTGMPAEELLLQDAALSPTALSKYAQLTAELSVVDTEGQKLNLKSNPTTIEFIQLQQLRANNLGYRVEEKYALILFDFDSDAIKERNAAIVDTIAERIRQFPEAEMAIVGHTDIIGKEDYNLKLSERRAKAVYDQITQTIGDATHGAITHMGVGQTEPLYENNLPENRALNRTVTVTLQYEKKD